MNEQTENELICEKLLGWKRWAGRGQVWKGLWSTKNFQIQTTDTPTFTTWAEAGLILDALDAIEPEVILRKFRVNDVNWTARTCKSEGFGNTGPLAIRAMALEYLRAAVQAAEVGERP